MTLLDASAPWQVFETTHPVPELATAGSDLSRCFELVRATGSLPLDLRDAPTRSLAAGARSGAPSIPAPETPAEQQLPREGNAGPIFLDLETTGLSNSPATLVVIVGLAFFKGGSCLVRQYVLVEPSAEKRLLTAVAADLRQGVSLVTFNGKSFDLPMLLNRFHLHRLPDPCPPLHLDLLHPARRIWSRRLRQSSLAALEARVLGSARESDVLGSEIPVRYFDFVRDRRWETFEPVVDHNRQDLVSLARLALRVEMLLRSESNAPQPSPPDLLGLGALHEATGRPDSAKRCYEGALASVASADRVEALHRLATLSHRADDIPRAAELYDAVSRYHCRQAVLASVELAKIHEHRTGDLVLALQYAQRAGELMRATGIDVPRGLVGDLDRRAARLERKTLGRSS